MINTLNRSNYTVPINKSDNLSLHHSRYWSKYYKANTTNSYKDRHYILDEFIQLRDALVKDYRSVYLADIGCGMGNALAPIIEIYPSLKVYACDCSKEAISLLQANKLYNKDTIYAEKYDILVDPIKKLDCNFLFIIFVLSSVSPEHHQLFISRIVSTCCKGAYIFFRDYHEYDMAQLRFAMKGKSKLKERYYMRSNGTTSYFFKKDEVSSMFVQAGCKVVDAKVVGRVIENRKTKDKMNRLWIQGIYQVA